MIKKLIYFKLAVLAYIVVLAGAIGGIVSAVITTIPDSNASKACAIGYKAHCSFVPYSTLISIGLALIFGFIFILMYRKKYLWKYLKNLR